jgi:hypothetical protein
MIPHSGSIAYSNIWLIVVVFVFCYSGTCVYIIYAYWCVFESGCIQYVHQSLCLRASVSLCGCLFACACPCVCMLRCACVCCVSWLWHVGHGEGLRLPGMLCQIPRRWALWHITQAQMKGKPQEPDKISQPRWTPVSRLAVGLVCACVRACVRACV